MNIPHFKVQFACAGLVNDMPMLYVWGEGTAWKAQPWQACIPAVTAPDDKHSVSERVSILFRRKNLSIPERFRMGIHLYHEAYPSKVSARMAFAHLEDGFDIHEIPASN